MCSGGDIGVCGAIRDGVGGAIVGVDGDNGVCGVTD